MRKNHFNRNLNGNMGILKNYGIAWSKRWVQEAMVVADKGIEPKNSLVLQYKMIGPNPN